MSGRRGRRDLLALALGLAVSTAGDMAALTALLLRLQPAGSGWVAALLAAELVPVVVLAPLAGRTVDRLETHRVLVVALAAQAVVAVPLAMLSTPWVTVLLFAALSAFSIFVRPATSALVPVITGEAEAARGYSRLATGSSIGVIVGPVLGGLITATLGVTTALLIDAASFAVLTVAALFVRARRRPSAAKTSSDESGARGGYALIWGSKVLRPALAVTAVAVGCAVVDNVAAPFRFVDQLGTSATVYGAYLTLWGAGAFVGVQLLPRLPKALTETALATGNLLMGVGITGIGVAPNVPVAFVSSVVGGVGNGMSNVALNALLAANTPETHRGRVFASSASIVQAALGVGTAAGAPLVGGLGANRAMIVAGSLCAVISVYGVARAARHRRLAASRDDAQLVRTDSS